MMCQRSSWVKTKKGTGLMRWKEISSAKREVSSRSKTFGKLTDVFTLCLNTMSIKMMCYHLVHSHVDLKTKNNYKVLGKWNTKGYNTVDHPIIFHIGPHSVLLHFN